jgi:hypothetical protein
MIYTANAGNFVLPGLIKKSILIKKHRYEQTRKIERRQIQKN